MTWRKGCLCGCLIPDECRYYQLPTDVQIVHIVHHVQRPPDPDVIDAECVVVDYRESNNNMADGMAD